MLDTFIKRARQCTESHQLYALCEEISHQISDSQEALSRPPQPPPAPQNANDATKPDSESGSRFIALDQPQMVPAEQATWLNPDDYVLGVELNGEMQAFPVLQMAYHNIVNTTVGGKPLLITYCLPCSSGVVLNPVVGGVRYTFDVFSMYNGFLVISDRQTGSLWKHYDGKLLAGPLIGSGTRLTLRPLLHTQWSEWVTLHPDTLVLDWYPEFADNYISTQSDSDNSLSDFRDVVLSWDNRYPKTNKYLE